MKIKIVLISCYLIFISSYSLLKAQINESDSLALVALYNSADGENWAYPWNLDESVASWHGIVVDNERVIEIRLGTLYADGPHHLYGYIPEEIGNLTELKLLDLGSNELYGTLPEEIGNLVNLKSLYLSGNNIAGEIPEEIGNMTSLEHLVMTHNDFSGPLPATIGNLSNLIGLRLSVNHISGNIPPELANLSKVKTIDFYYNNLNGSIPSELGNLPVITSLGFMHNNLSGEIPVELSNLSDLSILNLAANDLEGEIPVELGQLNNLTSLNLSGNHLTGTIPAEFKNFTKIHTLWIAENNLSGAFPEEMANLSNLRSLLIYSNQITDLPDLSQNTNLADLGIRAANNLLGFSDILTNLEIINDGGYFEYEDQGKVDDSYSEILNLGASHTMSVSELTEGTNYQWKKDGDDIEGANSTTYVIENFSDFDAGVYECFMTHPDIPDLTLIRNPITIVEGELEVKYEIQNSNIACEESVICYPVSAASDINNAIGLDFTINYDPSKLIPTGNFTFNENIVEDVSYISFTSNAEAADGILNLTAYFNSNAPADNEINGVGEVLCIEFEITDEFSEGGTDLSIESVFESYVTGVEEFTGNSASISINVLSEFSSSVKYWNEESDLTSINNSTVIFGMDENCELNGFNSIADQNGNFIVDLSNEYINIYRDIAGDYENEEEAIDVMEEINGADAALLEKILIKDVSFLPSPYQMLAADVNMDGFISAGDLSQLSQRTILSIPEFKQAWNYDNDNSPNGNGISYDWIFIDKNYETQNSSYAISETYPEDDGIGYSKFNLPDWSMCLEVPIQDENNCTQNNNTHYNAILLGDIDGNWNSSGSSLLRRKGNENVLFVNLNESIDEENFIYIPLQMKTKNVNSLDIALTFNNENLEFIESESKNGVGIRENVINNTLRITSYSQTNYESGNQFVLKFKKLKNDVIKEDFEGIRAFINGERGNAVLEGNFTLTGLKMNDISSEIKVYPNPSEKVINIEFTGDLKGETEVKLYDLKGKAFFVSNDFNKTISISGLPNGIYLLQIINGNNRGIKKVVKF